MAAAYEIKPKLSGILFVEFYVDGERKRVTCATRDPGTAKERARRIVAGGNGLNAKHSDPKSRAITMAVLFDQCQRTIWSPREVRSQATVRSNIKILNTLIGKELVTDMTHQRLERLVEELFAQGYAPGTVDRKLNAVGAALGRATVEVDVEGRPWLLGKPKLPKITVDNFCDRVVSATEQEAIFAAITHRAVNETTRDWQRFYFLIRFLLDTGCRLGEALKLTSVMFEARDTPTHGRVTFAMLPRYLTKNKAPRQIPLTSELAATIPNLVWGLGGKPVFKFSAATAWYMWSNIRADLRANGMSIDDVKLHTLRHTCITRLARSGRLRLEQIADWAGHKNLQITRDRYAHMMPEDQLSVLDVLNDLAPPEPTSLLPSDGLLAGLGVLAKANNEVKAA